LRTIREECDTFSEDVSYRSIQGKIVGRTTRDFDGKKFILIGIVVGYKTRITWANLEQYELANTILRD